MAKPELRDHRKFLKLKRLLGDPVPHLIGYLECLWIRGYQTGSPVLGDELDVEAAAEYPGEVGRFAKAAVAAGFVDVDKDGVHSIHDLFQHAPKYVQLRMVRKKTAPAGTTWESVTGRKPKRKPEESGTNELENEEVEYERTAKPSPKPKLNPKDKNLEPRTKNQEPKAKNRKQVTASLAEPGPDDGPNAPASTTPDAEFKALFRPLFESVAEVTGLDPSTAGSLLGGVAKELRKACPPYTPDEIRDFGARFGELCPWGPEKGRLRPTPKELQTHIGKLRASPPPASAAILPPSAFAKPPPMSFRERDRLAADAVLESLRAMSKAEPALAGSTPEFLALAEFGDADAA